MCQVMAQNRFRSFGSSSFHSSASSSSSYSASDPAPDDPTTTREDSKVSDSSSSLTRGAAWSGGGREADADLGIDVCSNGLGIVTIVISALGSTSTTACVSA
jgi:hypothetical protein